MSAIVEVRLSFTIIIFIPLIVPHQSPFSSEAMGVMGKIPTLTLQYCACIQFIDQLSV